MSRALAEEGYTVLEARDGGEVLEVMSATQGSVALVLADLVMGGMGGGELRDRLADIAPLVPVLLMSGHASDELLGGRLVSHDDQVQQKPFDLAHVAPRIRKLLDTRNAPPS